MSTYRLSAALQYGSSVEVLVVFNSIAILDNAFGTAEGWWGTIRN